VLQDITGGYLHLEPFTANALYKLLIYELNYLLRRKTNTSQSLSSSTFCQRLKNNPTGSSESQDSTSSSKLQTSLTIEVALLLGNSD